MKGVWVAHWGTQLDHEGIEDRLLLAYTRVGCNGNG